MSKEKTKVIKCHACKKTLKNDEYVAFMDDGPHCLECMFRISCEDSTASDDNKSSKELGSILKDAYNIINGNRQNSYGTPEDSFARISDYWNTYLKHKNLETVLTPHDVAMMMVLFKIAREEHQHKQDNLVDICGYTAILDAMYGD